MRKSIRPDILLEPQSESSYSQAMRSNERCRVFSLVQVVFQQDDPRRAEAGSGDYISDFVSKEFVEAKYSVAKEM
jgi:hypothetical protein